MNIQCLVEVPNIDTRDVHHVGRSTEAFSVDLLYEGGSRDCVLLDRISVSVLNEREGGYLIRGDVEVFAVQALEVFVDAAGDKTSDIEDYILVSRICALNRKLTTVEIRQQLHHFDFRTFSCSPPASAIADFASLMSILENLIKDLTRIEFSASSTCRLKRSSLRH